MTNTMINRTELIELSNAAFQLGNLECARKLLIAWLKAYPNDLWIRYRLAIVLYKTGKKNEAIRLAELIVCYDPEFSEVWALLATLYPDESDEKKDASNRVKQLRDWEKTEKKGVSLGFLSRFAGMDKSEKSYSNIEDVDDFDVFSALRIAKNEEQRRDANSYFRIMRIYIRRWQKALQFKLLLGDLLVKTGDPVEGMKLIHSTLANDLVGQVANRLWRGENPYHSLWLNMDSLRADISNISISIDVAKKAKLDQSLAIDWEMPVKEAAKPNSEKGEIPFVIRDMRADHSESDHDVDTEGEQQNVLDLPIAESVEPIIQAETAHQVESQDVAPTESRQTIQTGATKTFLNRLFPSIGAKNALSSSSPVKEFVYKLDVKDADERFPVYVVMSTIAGLTRKYGKNNKDFIDQEMHSVADAVESREGWNAMVFYPDEFQATQGSSLDPQMIRNELIKLDEKLSQKGSMIGALLIVGGHDVVPFFSLQNPTMDDDMTIHSDAPYASHDPKRYQDQQWQLGRIPGDSSNDTGLLLSQLRAIQNFHLARYEAEKVNGKRRSGKLIKPGRSMKNAAGKSFGYCCAVWQRPSVAVYRNISDQADLLTSPATMASNFPSSRLEGIDYGYFNLHGIKGQPNWYGQKDSRDTSPIPTIPVALEMQNVQRVGKTPKIVFAENCYGAEIVNRNESNALSLHMLGKGTRVFVGSTVIAYGAMNLPLTAADLLGHLFWKHLRTGVSSGEAFRRAKKNMAVEIEAANGALDGEIQKTIISFVFYGDPLYTVDENADITDRMQRAKTAKSYELVREKMDSKVAIDMDMAKRIYTEVCELYDMKSVNDEFSTFAIQRQMLNTKSTMTPQQALESQNYVIVYSKDSRVGNLLDRLITRVTVSRDGKIKKVSFSR